jgi:hypothetical protein
MGRALRRSGPRETELADHCRRPDGNNLSAGLRGGFGQHAKQFVPYVLEVHKLPYALGAPSALTENTTQISTNWMGLVRYELAAFIRNASEVITGPAAERT